jgi:hypothetical protein
MKRHLGDGVYGEMEGRILLLTTEDGVSVTNRIVLEPEVIDDLLGFLIAANPERVGRLKAYLESVEGA